MQEEKNAHQLNTKTIYKKESKGNQSKTKTCWKRVYCSVIPHHEIDVGFL